jgi:hypothetical protein
MSGNKQLQQMVREVKEFMKYAVADDLIESAAAVVNRYRNSPRILNLLREYYIALPDAREEPVLRIAQLMQHQGVSLFVVTTPSVSYLYVSSASQVVWLGEYKDELDPEILDYFGFNSQEEFLKICLPAAHLEEYGVNHAAEPAVCPACGVKEGELHLLGCSVEICPWCEGQLCKCNCRFEQLELDAIDREEQLEEFEDLLAAKGRIPFKLQHAPYYPGTSEGMDIDDPDE